MLNIENMRGNTEGELESINMIQYLPVSDATHTAIREATEADSTLRQLKTIIRQGWPASNKEVSEIVSDYFSFREELSIQNRLVFKGERLIIPASRRDNMLAKIHASHIGIQGCLRRAREVAYWPRMDKDVTAYVAKPTEQGKEPLICHELPTRTWEKIAVDLFDLNGT